MPIEALRTDDARFADLPDFPWKSHTAENLPGYQGLRLSWLDEGPADAEHTFLCLHGQPTWSYLYRKMLPVFVAAGGRVVAPDFYGFGRSDKPVDESVYTFDFHRNAILALVERLDLKRITLVVQDWGGLIGLTLPLDIGDRIERLIIMNTAISTGGSPGPGFEAWLAYSNSKPDLAVGRLLARSCPQLNDAEAAAYDAPFPDVTYKAGVRRFPQIVPIREDMEGAGYGRPALGWWRSFEGPAFMAIGMNDPVLGPPIMRVLHRQLKTCPPPMEIADAGHFVQESGEAVARAALESFEGA